VKPLAPGRIRARRRPGAILLLWAFRLLGAWLVAAPVADAYSSGLGHLPGGDAVVFEAGGTYLLEALRLNSHQLLAAIRQGLWALLVMGAAGLVPLCALLVALCHAGRLRAGEWSHRTASHLPTLAALVALTLLVQVALGILAALGLLGLRQPGHCALGPPGAQWPLLALVFVAAVLCLTVGVLSDLARAAAVLHGAGVAAACRLALRTARGCPTRVLLDWLTPAIWSLLAVAAAAILVHALRVQAAAGWRLLAVFSLHQLTALLLVALRANWLARALRAVGSQPLRPEP
jgi:hypothetical protein